MIGTRQGTTEREAAAEPAEGRAALAGHWLATTGMTAVVAGLLVLVTTLLPGAEGSDPADGIGFLTVVMVGAAITWLVVIAVGVPGTRTVFSVLLAAVSALALARVVSTLPTAGPGGGLDPREPHGGLALSLPLIGVALGLMAFGALVTVVANTRWLVGDPGRRAGLARRERRVVAVGSAAAMTVLAVALTAGVVPLRVAEANLDASTTGQAAPPDRPPALDGGVAWTARLGDGPARALGTAGGVAVVEPAGLRMLDPATGAQRWSFRRWDSDNLLRDGLPAVSADGRWIAAAATIRAQRPLLVDTFRAGTRLWVFDAVTGEARADTPLPERSVVRAVDQRRAVLSLPTGYDERGDQTGEVLAAVGDDGVAAWRFDPGTGCRTTWAAFLPGGGIVSADDVLALIACRKQAPRQGMFDLDTYLLTRIDGTNGTPIWRWAVDEYGADPAVLGFTERRQTVAVQVAGDLAVLDVPVAYQGGEGRERVRHNLVGLRLDDGRPAWERLGQDYGPLADYGAAAGVGQLHAAGGTVVSAERHQTGTGRDARYSVALRAATAATGKPSLAVDLPDSGPRTDVHEAVTLLRDGRLLVLDADGGARDPAKRCTIHTWDLAAGARRAPVNLGSLDGRAGAGSLWCERGVLFEVPGGVGVQIPVRGAGERAEYLAVLR